MRAKVWLQRGILAVAVGYGALGGVGKLHDKIRTASAKYVVSPLPDKQVLLFSLDNFCVDLMHSTCFERAVGQRMDGSGRYFHLGEAFPFAEAELLNNSGRAPFFRLKLAPLELLELLRGKHDEGLEDLNEDLIKYGRRIMLGIDMANISENPNLRPAVNRLLKTLTAENLTIVWNPALGNDPPARVKWNAIELFQVSKDGKWPTFAELYAERVVGNKLPVFLTIASNAPWEIQMKFMQDGIQAATSREEIKALQFFNLPDANGNWKLLPETVTGIKEALKPHTALFASDVSGNPQPNFTPTLPTWHERRTAFDQSSSLKKTVTVVGDALGFKGEGEVFYNEYSATSCKDLGNNFYTKGELDQEIRIRHQIETLRQKLANINGDEKIYEAALRQGLAELYISLADLTPNNTDRVRLFYDALKTVDVPFTRSQQRLASDGIPIVPGYFDVKIQLALRIAELDLVGNLHEVEEQCDEIVKLLEDNRTVVEELIADYDFMVQGYTSRLNLAWGTVNERRKNYQEASRYYNLARDWALKHDKRQTATVGALGLSRILLLNGEKADAEKALKLLGPLFNWEELGSEDGFMDRGYEAMLLIMRATTIIHPHDLEKVKALFYQRVPWKKINEYDDFKKVLDCEHYDLTDPNLSTRWEMFLGGFGLVKLNPNQQARLNDLRAFTEIYGKK